MVLRCRDEGKPHKLIHRRDEGAEEVAARHYSGYSRPEAFLNRRNNSSDMRCARKPSASRNATD